MGQNTFQIVEKESPEFKKLEDFIKSKEPVKAKTKGKNTKTFWRRVTKKMRKEPDFIEGFKAYKTKYCLPKLVEPLVPSGKTKSTTTKRPRGKNNEEANRKVKKQKNRGPGI